ncbi:MAG: hypothetical protein HY718_19450 [Planctomycetes bacterium]|nr:hypothetical protein [Planctomycetota bacterium]
MSTGCILGNRPQFVRGGDDTAQMTYYLDGAGNMGFGLETVPLGLMDGGYTGQVDHFIWATYLGPFIDQVSYSHNRSQGRRLARKIQEYLDQHPGASINIIGLSAGSGVAVFAVESLAPKHRVDNLIMLSSSLSADYDLGRALRCVRGGIYFFWSPNDPILRGVVPLVGTVDRENTSQVAGATGARPPVAASRETRQVYSQRVHNVRWYTNGIGGPLQLRHAGTTDRAFIRDMVAPILVRRPLPEKSPSSRPGTRPPLPPTARPVPTSGRVP